MSLDWLGESAKSLVAVTDHHRLLPEVAEAFAAMQAAAANDGIDCQLVSSFRGFDHQCSIWNRKWRGEAPLYDAKGIKLDYHSLSDQQKLHAILTWSALPGGSRHHWGTDIDVYDRQTVKAREHQFELVEAEYCAGGPCAELANWLTNNAEQFGFVRPFAHYNGGVACEPWHLSHQRSAAPFENARNVGELASKLAASDIEGKATILAELDALFERYILNKGMR